MSKIIEPSKKVQKAFLEFIRDNYSDRDFGAAEATNAFFKHRYETNDDWTDVKNLTGHLKRKDEKDETYAFVEEKPSRVTGRKCLHYRLRDE